MPMESQMMRWNRCENKLAVICGTVSSEITSTQACHDGQRNEHHQYIFEYLHRNTLRASKLPVESHVDDGMEIQREKQYQQDGEPSQ